MTVILDVKFIRDDKVCLGEGTWVGGDYNAFQIINVEEEICLPSMYASNVLSFSYLNL